MAGKPVGPGGAVTILGTEVGGDSALVLGSRGGRLGARVAHYGAVSATIYLMVRYPSLVNATLAALAGWLGVDPWIVQFLFWFVALCVLLRLTLALLSPLSSVLGGLSWMLGTAANWTRPARVAGGAGTTTDSPSFDA